MSHRTFADLGISTPVSKALARNGIETPFPVQSLVIPDVLAGRDVLAQSPTGSGKTIAFAAPIADRIKAGSRRNVALVLAPTRELACQIVDDAEPLMAAANLSVAAVYGGVGIEAQAKRARKAHLLVATPGRLIDLMQRGAVNLENVEIVVLDEADRMLDMGFRPDVDRIVRTTRRDRQTLFFSATLEGEVGQLAKLYTRNARRHEYNPTGSKPDIEHRFVKVEHTDKVGKLVEHLGEERDLALVFVRTRRGADRLVKRLDRQGVSAAAMHGGKSQANRTRTLRSFESGRIDALIATDVAARGIDVTGISHVINFDPPEDGDTYTHRVGRTARAGRSGVGVTFVMADQAQEVGAIARGLELRQEFRGSGHSAAANGGTGANGNGGRSERTARSAAAPRGGNEERTGRPRRNGRQRSRSGRR